MTNIRAITGWSALALLLVAVSFAAGALWRHKAIIDAAKNPDRVLPHVPTPSATAARVEIASSTAPLEFQSPRNRPFRPRETLDTALLPLLKDTVPLPVEAGVGPGSGGGLVVVDDAIIVVDQSGKFAVVRDKGDRIGKLALPDLPNNAAEYAKQAAPPREIAPGVTINTGFVVHDVDFRREAAGIRLLVSYEKFLPELKTTALTVSAILLNEVFAPLGAWEDIYRGQPLQTEWYSGIAGGGRMLIRGDKLLLTVGDYNQDNVFMNSRLESQSPESDFGKVLSIDLRTKARTIVSSGHRNPQGLTVTSSGTIYSTEHGPRGGDLLTRIVPGTNFGWPIVTLGTHYWSYQWPNRNVDTAGKTFTSPTYAWVPSIGASNLIEVAGFDRAWDKDLLVESLKAKSLYRIRLDGENRVVYSEPIWIGERLRDIGSLSDGTLVLFTDSAKLIFLSVDAAKLAANKREWPLPINPQTEINTPQTACVGCP